jgi:hypothetical protein
MRLGGFAEMGLDPNTHTFVLATALMTSVAFAILALNVIALVLQHVYS